MKTNLSPLCENLFLPGAVAAVLGSVLLCQAPAQTFKALHNFNGVSEPPRYALCLVGSTLYGTIDNSLYQVNTDSTGFAILHVFSSEIPSAALSASGNTLYRTTASPVFSIDTDGTGFTTLYNLNATEGAGLVSVLLVDGIMLYGTATHGGAFGVAYGGWGTIFSLNVGGGEFSVLHNFSFGSDGYFPSSNLLLSSNNSLYGTAWLYPPGNGNGTIFAVKTDSTGFTNVYNCSALIPYYTNSSGLVVGTNYDGWSLSGEMVLLGNTLYGTATQGGISGNGCVQG